MNRRQCSPAQQSSSLSPGRFTTLRVQCHASHTTHWKTIEKHRVFEERTKCITLMTRTRNQRVGISKVRLLLLGLNSRDFEEGGGYENKTLHLPIFNVEKGG